jgi:zinc/manganese transport system substrate-binding protein
MVSEAVKSVSPIPPRPSRNGPPAAAHGLAAALAAACLATAVAGCGGSGTSLASSSGRPSVVAAENFWGSLAAQLGGDRLQVSSILVNPSTDPHSYEPSAADAIALARSRMAIVNGIGYDGWASRLLDANPDSTRTVLDAGRVLGLKQGANPHQWYSPSAVERVVGAITSAYKRLDPKDAGYFDRRRTLVLSGDLARYDELRREIRRRYAGVPVGYSESIFQPLGQDLGLRLVTPYSYARAIAEGADVSAADKQTVDSQVSRGEVKVWVFNRQNVTPDVQRVNQLAGTAHVPVATVTETLSPPSDSFEQWQENELTRLLQALHSATGR